MNRNIHLVDIFERNKVEGYSDLKKRRYIQWSILQHYEVCDTPLLDFTQSLRVACSFALLENNEKDAFIYVFGLPYVTNRISINSEHDLINVRLLSICPPTAFRPYFQEGYLVGTPDITSNYDNKNELDFNNRLIAKFKIPNRASFWGDGFQIIPKISLYPPKDPIEILCNELKFVTDRELRAGTLGDFLKVWAEIEDKILYLAQSHNYKSLSVREAIRILYDKSVFNTDELHSFDFLRKFRNIVVHKPKEVSEPEAQKYLQLVTQLNNKIS